MWNRTTPPRRLAGILTGAFLTYALAGLAALISNLVERPAVMLVTNVAAFMGVGWLTLRLRQGAHVIEPAIGSGSAVLVFGLIQIALVPAFRAELGWGQILTSLVVSIGFAFSFAWLGALLTTGGRGRAPTVSAAARWPRTSGATRAPRREPLGGPESRPAPHSG